MQKFSNILLDNSNKARDLNIEEIFPKPLLGNIISFGKLAKWAAYIDKYLIFPNRLKSTLSEGNQNLQLIHIIDHSNAIYLKTIRKISSVKCLLTCHDLIAIQTALGKFAPAPTTSFLGKRLQSRIQHSLPIADFFACDSEQTKNDLNRIIQSSASRSKVIHLGTNFELKSLGKKIKTQPDLPFDTSKMNFILHVGSAAWYKNRKAVFRAFQNAKQQNQNNDLKLVLVGPSPQADEVDGSLKKWLDSNSNDIILATNVSEAILQELYLNADLLLFPSFIEGFGWPPLEAAACGCQVITTKTGAIHDLLGRKARYVDPSDQDSVNLAVIKSLKHRDNTNQRISLPSDQQCREVYFNLYRRLLR